MKKNINSILKHKYFNYIIIFTILFISLSLFLLNKNKIIESFDNRQKYYRCNEKNLGTITNIIFDKNNIIKDNKNWNIYVPCGYNNVENELLTIKVKNNNLNKKYIFGINGCDLIVSKNKIWESLVDCFGRENASKYMPESYVLHDKKDLNLLKKRFKINDIYILKKNIQRKEGLKLTSDLNVMLNGSLENYKVAQKYLTNLYLVNKHKINLRIYLLIVIKDGYKFFYISKIGKCIYTRKEYNDNNFDFESNITSYNLDMNIYKKNPRNFIELFNYVNNNNQNAILLASNIHILMLNVSKCISTSISQSSNLKNTTCFQIFGADVIFDNNLNAYLLEFNKGPDMIPRDEEDKKMKLNVQNDMFKKVGILKDTEENVFKEIYKIKL